MMFSPIFRIGIDEAGRGAWAGPVVAAAVYMPEVLACAADSKVLTAAQREILYAAITATAVFGIGEVSARDIDAMGIKAATNQAMRLALAAVLQQLPKEQGLYVLVDGNDKFTFDSPHRSYVRGDAYLPSISCASIIAKVHRDRLMCARDEEDTRYGFARHKGYGTAFHQETLAVHGPSDFHRASYAPIRQLLNQRVY